MRARAEGLDDQEVIHALAAGWGFDAETIAYAPLGFGSYHWIATDADRDRRFVTVDDVGADGLAGLGRAFDTTVALRAAGLGFVVAPLPAADGASVRRLDARYSIAVHPFLDGRAGRFGEAVGRGERAGVLDLLIALHASTHLVRDGAPSDDLAVPGREHIDRALEALEVPWTGGVLSEPTRAWLAAHARDVRRLLHDFDELAAWVSADPGPPVITHGEPHPGNVIRTTTGLNLVDWDTVGLALPERDLWLVADDADDRARYAEATGHRPDESAIALYALRWQLADIAVYLELLRSPHPENADTRQSYEGLDAALRTGLTRRGR